MGGATPAGRTFERGDLEALLSQDTRVALRHWQVAASPAPTATAFGVEDLGGSPIALGTLAAAALVGATAEFQTGVLGGNPAAVPPTPRQGVQVTATGTGGVPQTLVLSVEAGLSAPPAAGDQFVVLGTASGASKAAPLQVLNVAGVAAAGNTGAPGAAGTYTPPAHVSKLLVTAQVTYGAAIAAAPTINVFTSPDRVNWDSQANAIVLGSVSDTAVTTQQATFVADERLAGAAELSFQVVNNDAANALGAVVVTVQAEVGG